MQELIPLTTATAAVFSKPYQKTQFLNPKQFLLRLDPAPKHQKKPQAIEPVTLSQLQGDNRIKTDPETIPVFTLKHISIPNIVSYQTDVEVLPVDTNVATELKTGHVDEPV